MQGAGSSIFLRAAVRSNPVLAANILFEGSTPKLADLGVCRVANAGTLTAFAVGTLTFAAPEQLQYSRYDVAVDVWALGCVFACIAHNTTTPYPGVTVVRSDEVLHIVAAVARGMLLPSAPLDHCLHTYVRDCAAIDPTERPNAASLVLDFEAEGRGTETTSRLVTRTHRDCCDEHR